MTWLSSQRQTSHSAGSSPGSDSCRPGRPATNAQRHQSKSRGGGYMTAQEQTSTYHIFLRLKSGSLPYTFTARGHTVDGRVRVCVRGHAYTRASSPPHHARKVKHGGMETNLCLQHPPSPALVAVQFQTLQTAQPTASLKRASHRHGEPAIKGGGGREEEGREEKDKKRRRNCSAGSKQYSNADGHHWDQR